MMARAILYSRSLEADGRLALASLSSSSSIFAAAPFFLDEPATCLWRKPSVAMVGRLKMGPLLLDGGTVSCDVITRSHDDARREELDESGRWWLLATRRRAEPQTNAPANSTGDQGHLRDGNSSA